MIKREIFALPYKFGSSGIGAYVVPSHACVNTFYPGSLWSWRNAASALSLFPFPKATLWEQESGKPEFISPDSSDQVK